MNVCEFLNAHYWPEHALTLKRASLDQLRWAVITFDRWLTRPSVVETDFDRLRLLTYLAARQQKVSPATVNKDRRSLLCLWRHAAELGMVAPPPKIPKAKCPQAVPHTFTHDELHRLLLATNEMHDRIWWRSLLLALLDTAARVSAMLAAKVEDVSFSNATIHLRPEHSKTMQGHLCAVSKTDTLPALAAQCLGREPSDLVWPWPRKTKRRLFTHFRELCEKAGVKLPRFKAFHSLRRTTATNVASDPQLGLLQASRLLQHSSIAVTSRYIDFDRVQASAVRICDRLPRP